MAIDTTKFIEVCENVASMKIGLDKTGDHLVRVEKKVDAHGAKLSKIQKQLNGGLVGPLDTKTLLKYGLIAFALLVGGGAGADGVRELVKLLIGM
jgi:hypothetical protein